jgi:hypothetical protein
MVNFLPKSSDYLRCDGESLLNFGDLSRLFDSYRVDRLLSYLDLSSRGDSPSFLLLGE